MLKRFSLAILLVVTLGAAHADDAEETWFGFSQSVKVSWRFQVKSATVNYVHPDTEAQATGLQVGDAIVAVEDCAIPGCSSRRAKALMQASLGETRTFQLQRPDGERYAATLAAIPYR